MNWDNPEEVREYMKQYHKEWYKLKKGDPEFINRRKEYAEEWEQINRERRRQQNKKWREANKEHLKKYMLTYKEKNSDKIKKQKQQKRSETRIKVLAYYSDSKLECNCCKENQLEFLTIDHINGGGNKHRKSLKKLGVEFYRWLELQGFPEGYRILCYNCNSVLGHFGYCPHQTNTKVK